MSDWDNRAGVGWSVGGKKVVIKLDLGLAGACLLVGLDFRWEKVRSLGMGNFKDRGRGLLSCDRNWSIIS